MQEINCNVEQCPTGIDLRMRLAFNKKKIDIHYNVYLV